MHPGILFLAVKLVKQFFECTLQIINGTHRRHDGCVHLRRVDRHSQQYLWDYYQPPNRARWRCLSAAATNDCLHAASTPTTVRRPRNPSSIRAGYCRMIITTPVLGYTALD